MVHLEVLMNHDTDLLVSADRTFALMRAGIPLSLLLDLAAPVPSEELLRGEPADTSWVPHAVA